MRRFVIEEKHGGVTVTPALFKPVTAEITARKMGSFNIDFHTWGGHIMSLSAGSPTLPQHSGTPAEARQQLCSGVKVQCAAPAQ